MSSVRNKSDDEYSVIGDKGDIGFIDFDNCRSVCNYNPSDESEIVNISIPFPLVNGKPQSGFVGETIFDSVTIKNITAEPLDLWKVSIYDSKPEDSFKISLMEPPTSKSDVQYIQDFVASFSLEDKVIRTDRDMKIWLSCEPKEIGLYLAAVHFSVGDETIERLVFVLAEDKISKSLSSTRPYQRARRKKQEVVNVHSGDGAYVVGRRPSKGTNNGGFRNRLDDYPIPGHIRDILNSQQIPDAVSEGLTESNYGSFFMTLLAMEEIKLEEDMRAYDMGCISLKRKKNQFLTLEVPGLAEKRPSLVNGDFIFAKLAGDDQTATVPYQGYIHRVEAEEIYLKFDQKFHQTHRETNLYNVQFTYNRTGMRRLYQTVEAAECLNKNFLFPSESSKISLVAPTPMVPISCTLNEEQMSAIEMILTRKGGPPYLIHGPPGTGKTMTLIEAILQIYRSKTNARILVCAPSNSAADHILERLISEKSVQIQKNDIFRLNAFTRPFEDVNPNHIEFCFVEDFIFKCPTRWDLVKYRIIISTYTSASFLYAEGIKRGHFSYFFLDEAGQASEPETMVPLSNLYSKDSMVILAGDPMQLGPVVFSRDAEGCGLGTSYLERLFDCEVYSSGNESFMTKLVRNYRTHEVILHLPSELFYDGELMPCKEENMSFSKSWEDILPNKEFPLLFMGIQGCDEREGSNPSWFNRIEASKVVEIIRVLIEQKGLVEDDIGVITPYRQQVGKIRGALESLGWPTIKVGSVEQFQGQERQVIIISTVRSTIKHNEFDKVHYLGFLSNPRRFNVAITRARSLLVVIGNPHILCKDPNWNNLLWYCVDNGSYKGCFLPEKEVFSADEPAGTDHTEGQYMSYGGENDFKPSDGNWDDKGDGWQISEPQWPSEEHSTERYDVKNDFRPSKGNWDEGDGWQLSEPQRTEEEHSYYSYNVKNGVQPSKENWDDERDGWQEPQWALEQHSNYSYDVKNDFQPSKKNWDDERDGWQEPLRAPGQHSNYSHDVKNDIQPSKRNWDDGRDGWQLAEPHHAPEEHSNHSYDVENDFKPSDGNWDDKGDGWQISEPQWPSEEHNTESYDVKNDFQPSKGNWDEGDGWQLSEPQRTEEEHSYYSYNVKNGVQPSKENWDDERDGWQEPQRALEQHSNYSYDVKNDFQPSKKNWDDERDGWQEPLRAPGQHSNYSHDVKNDIQPSKRNWDDGRDGWQLAEPHHAPEEHSNHSYDVENYIQPSGWD